VLQKFVDDPNCMESRRVATIARKLNEFTPLCSAKGAQGVWYTAFMYGNTPKINEIVVPGFLRWGWCWEKDRDGSVLMFNVLKILEKSNNMRLLPEHVQHLKKVRERKKTQPWISSLELQDETIEKLKAEIAGSRRGSYRQNTQKPPAQKTPPTLIQETLEPKQQATLPESRRIEPVHSIQTNQNYRETIPTLSVPEEPINTRREASTTTTTSSSPVTTATTSGEARLAKIQEIVFEIILGLNRYQNSSLLNALGCSGKIAKIDIIPHFFRWAVSPGL